MTEDKVPPTSHPYAADLSTPTQPIKPESPSPKRKWNWKQRTVVALASITIFAGIAIGYAHYDWLKSPFQIYLEAEAQTISDLRNEALILAESAKSRSLEGTTHESLAAQFHFDGLEQVDEDVQPIYEFLEQLKWVQRVQSNANRNPFYGSYQLMYQEEEWAHMEAAISAQKNGIRLAPFYDKWLVYEASNTAPTGERSALSRRIYSAEEWRDALQPSWNELVPIIARYANWLRANLDDTQFQLIGAQTVQAGSTSHEVRQLSVTFSDAQIKSFLGGLVYQITHDEELMALIHAKASAANRMAGETVGETVVEIPEFAQWRLEMQAFSEDFNAGLNAMMFRDTRMTLWIDQEDHVLKREWQIDLQTLDDQEWATISYRSISDRPVQAQWSETAFKMTDGEQVLLETRLENQVKPVDNEQSKHLWKWTQTLNIPGESPIQFVFDADATRKTTAQEDRVTAALTFGYGSQQIENTLRGTWMTATKQSTSDQIDQSWAFVWNVDGSQVTTNQLFPQKVRFEMNASTRVADTVQVPAWNNRNSEALAELTPDQEAAIISGFEEGLSSWIGEHFIELSVFFSLIGE